MWVMAAIPSEVDAPERIYQTCLLRNFTETSLPGYFLAAIVGSEWTIVYSGPDDPACQIVGEHDFPVKWVPRCRDSIVDR